MMPTYFEQIWQSRYFWIHLSLSDLRSKWRRSFFGALWSVIQPLGMTALLSIVFSKIFNVDIVEYAPYVLSGIIVWEFITSTAVGGALAFVQADAYIKQCRHPLAIYTLRTTLTNLFVLSLASLSLFAWGLAALPHNFNWSWLAILSLYPIAALIAWPMATSLAYMGVKFRDIPHALGLILQAFWFISPIYFEEKMFRAGDLHALIDYNPVYHLLQIARAPILSGNWPTAENYAYCLLTIAILSFVAWAIGKRAERKVIFYL